MRGMGYDDPMRRPPTSPRHLSALRRARNLCALAAVVVLGGCFSYTTAVPGVLDLRSDGDYADPLLAPPPAFAELSREGWASTLLGTGLRVEDGYVALEERQTWLGLTALFPGVFLVAGADPRDSLEVVLDGAALRDIQLSHSFTPLDALLSTAACATVCIPVLVPLHWFTFTLRGQRVTLVAALDEVTPLPPPLEADEPAPSSPSEGEQP